MQTPPNEHWLVGINPVASALAHRPGEVREVWVQTDTRNRRVTALADEARGRGVTVAGREAAALDALSDGRRHQGIAARCREPGPLDEAGLVTRVEAAGEAALVVVLDQVQDPGNLGACLRSAAAAGACAVVVPRHRAASLTPVARKAAAGGAAVVPLVEVANVRRVLERLKKAGVWVTGLAGEAEPALWQLDLTGPAALVLGGEEKGLRRLTRETCDQLARIPINGAVESLNVSVACGVALFEVARQRGG